MSALPPILTMKADIPDRQLPATAVIVAIRATGFMEYRAALFNPA
jgi:hypothetical protein